MNKEDKVKEYVQDTYNELHAPEGLRRKVMNMNELKEKKFGMSVVKKLAVAVAIAAVLFAGSNGVAYAMTGSTWVETMMAKISINGVWQDVEMEGEVLEDGTVQYSTTLEVEEGDTVDIVAVSDSEGPKQYAVTVDTTVVDDRMDVVNEDGIIYLVDGDVKIDITKDMEDGIATGSYEKNGKEFQYEVKEEPGVLGCFELHISGEE